MGEPRRARQEPAGSHELLHVARRLDWRFLLADSTLGEVGYLGPPDAPLENALRLFGDAVHRIDRQLATPGIAQNLFPVIVLVDPAQHVLRNAMHLVAPGGHLYAEVSRLFRRRRPATLRHPSSCAAALRRPDVASVRLYWHWPTFETCTRIVPLDEETPFAFLLEGADRGARMKAALGRRLLRSGVLGWGVPCFSVVARRTAA